MTEIVQQKKLFMGNYHIMYKININKAAEIDS